MQTAHQKEVTNLNARIASLTTSLSQLGSEKERLFTDLQFRQSELESARTQVESIQAQLVESNYQLRERDEQLSMVQVELAEARRTPIIHAAGNRMDRTILSAGPSGTEVARLLKEAESRSESRVAELRARLKTIESERAEQEENWARSLAARGEEVERLRGLLAFQEKEGTKVGDYKALREKEVRELEERLETLERQEREGINRHKEILGIVEGLKERLESRDFELGEMGRRLEAANGLVDELRGKESQLKNSNKVCTLGHH
jgi:chromosome segregation ATPase